MAKTRFTSLRMVDTGHIFATGTPRIFDAWDWIKNTVSHELGLSADDLDLVEDDDGAEFVAHQGQNLVEVCWGHRGATSQQRADHLLTVHQDNRELYEEKLDAVRDALQAAE
jgi:hypothetical protein